MILSFKNIDQKLTDRKPCTIATLFLWTLSEDPRDQSGKNREVGIYCLCVNITADSNVKSSRQMYLCTFDMRQAYHTHYIIRRKFTACLFSSSSYAKSEKNFSPVLYTFVHFGRQGRSVCETPAYSHYILYRYQLYEYIYIFNNIMYRWLLVRARRHVQSSRRVSSRVTSHPRCIIKGIHARKHIQGSVSLSYYRNVSLRSAKHAVHAHTGVWLSNTKWAEKRTTFDFYRLYTAQTTRRVYDKCIILLCTSSSAM